MRTFDYHVLDMIELGVKAYTPISEFKARRLDVVLVSVCPSRRRCVCGVAGQEEGARLEAVLHLQRR
jgi:hypothetical protein